MLDKPETVLIGLTWRGCLHHDLEILLVFLGYHGAVLALAWGGLRRLYIRFLT